MALRQAIGNTADGTSVTLTATLTGSTILVFGACSGTQITGITDNSGSNVYTQLVGSIATNGFACINAASATTVTVTGSTGHRAFMVCEETSAGIQSQDFNPATFTNSGVQINVSNNITPSNTTSTAYCFLGSAGVSIGTNFIPGTSGGATWAVPTGSNIVNGTVNNPGNCGEFVMRADVTTGATFQGTVDTITNHSFVVGIVSYKLPSGVAALQLMYAQRKILYFI